MILTVQCAIGSPGNKPVTTLQYANAGVFDGIVNIGSFQYGMNDGGIWQLNYSDSQTDDSLAISYVVKLNTSHFGTPGNVKKLRYVYVSMKGEYSGMSITTKPDDCTESKWAKCTPWQNGFRAAVGSRAQGSFWTVGLESDMPFTLFSIGSLYITRSSGISNR